MAQNSQTIEAREKIENKNFAWNDANNHYLIVFFFFKIKLNIIEKN